MPVPTQRALLKAGLAIALGAGSVPSVQAEPAREVNEQTQAWFSLNTTTRLDQRWGVVGDLHVRRNNFLADPSFNLLRIGAQHWLTDALTLTVGYAHNWVAAATEDGQTWREENRVYQQLQLPTRIGRVTVLHRLRNEQRWQEEVMDDQPTGHWDFSERVRYLLSLTIPVARDPRIPALVVSDEILFQFGSSIDANTFDQNRLFTGIKKSLGRNWSFDLGYMMVYQQKPTGDLYDLNHTLRWFFYFTPDLRARKSVP